MGPSLTAAEKAEVTPEGHMGSKRQGEDSKDTVLMPCVMFLTHAEIAQDMKLEDSKLRPSTTSY